MRLLPTLLLPAMMVFAACGAPQAPAESHSVVDVADAFIVQPPEGRDITGAGMHVSVKGAPLTLIGVTSDVADAIELHTMSMEDGVMQMRKVDGFPVSEGSPLVLERGGNHLMLFGLKPIEIGDEVHLVLTFADEEGGEQQVPATAEVVPISG